MDDMEADKSVQSPHNYTIRTPVSWNPVQSTNIRTKLGAVARNTQASHDDAQALVERQHGVSSDHSAASDIRWLIRDQKPLQKTTTEAALARCDALRKRLQAMDPSNGGESVYNSLCLELKGADVSYNYCLYYPSNLEFKTPPTAAARRNPLGASTRESMGKRIAIWNLTAECAKNGTLRDLKSGKLTENGPPELESSIFDRTPQVQVPLSKQDAQSLAESERKLNNPQFFSDKIDATKDKLDDIPEAENLPSAMDTSDDPARADLHTQATASPPAPVTLADLDEDTFKTQMKYIYPTRKPHEINKREILAGCTHCIQKGHTNDYKGSICPDRTCKLCGAFDQHTWKQCPTLEKCRKCRQKGHTKQQCQSKQPDIPLAEVLCEMCDRKGHLEGDCQLHWMGKLPSPATFKNPNISCYMCGGRGHPGNDCPDRPAGVPLASFNWGYGIPSMNIRSQSDIAIKGAARQDPIHLDDDEGSVDTFVRPKHPLPKRKGNIQVNVGSTSTLGNLGLSSAFTPITATPYNNSNTGLQGHGGGRGNGLPVNPNQQSSGYGQNTRPQGEAYRPMPSSAQQAWSKHRQ